MPKPNLLFLLFLSFVSSLTARQSVPIWSCPTENVKDDLVTLVHVDWSNGSLGIIQTPHFPHQFPLPLRCVWVFNNTQMNRKREKPWHLHIYLTQFYLLDNFFTLSTFNSTPEISLDKQMEWSKLEQIGVESLVNWSENRHIKTDDDVVILKLNIQAKSYDFLHQRVLEVNDAYGFNITFQGSETKEEVNGSCNLAHCNLNGECYADLAKNSSNTIGGFHCQCYSPKFNPSEHDEPFSGDQCQYLSNNRECSESKNTCKNGGTCRFFTSRYVVCDCPHEWTGHKCEILKTSTTHHQTSQQQHLTVQQKQLTIQQQQQQNQTLPTSNDQKENVTAKSEKSDSGPVCLDYYAKLEVDKSIAEKIVSAQHQKTYQNVVKIDSPTAGEPSTLYFPSSSPLTNQSLDILSKSLQATFGLGNSTKVVNSSFCAEQSLRLTTERRKGFVAEGDVFYLSCIVHGYKKPVFKWAKHFQYNEYRIDDYLSGGSRWGTKTSNSPVEDKNRYINFYTWSETPNTVASFLTLKPANSFDEGYYTCKVYETLHEGANISDLSKFPFQIATYKVEVLQKPKIEAFPMTATLVKRQPIEGASKGDDVKGYKHFRGHNTLHCFAASSVNRHMAERNYEFFWQRDGQNVSNIWPRTEHEEIMTEPPGKSLKLGLIEKGAEYTCVAVHRRDSRLRSSITVQVDLANSGSETCIRIPKDEIVWPETYKGAKAAVKCTKASGYMYLKCLDRQGHPHWPPKQPPDRSECLNEKLIEWENRIDRYLSGYVKDANDCQYLQKFIQDFNWIDPLTEADRKRTVILLWKIFSAIRFKNLPLNYESMADIFYKGFFLFANSSAEDVKSRVELFELLQTSTKVFGSKIGALQSPILGMKGFEWTEPVVSGCYQNSSVTVKLVQISHARINAFKKIWSYPDQTQNATVGNKIILAPIKEESELPKVCSGQTRVSFSLNSSDEKFLVKTTLAIIHYKELENVLEEQHNETFNDSSWRRMFSRYSSQVTVIYDNNLSYPAVTNFSVTIRFADALFASENESLAFNLSCGRIEWFNKGSPEPSLVRSEPSCILRWTADGMTCSCNKSGTYTLIRSWYVDEVSNSSRNVAAHYIATLGCGVGLTLTTLTLWKLGLELSGRITFLTLLQVQVSVMMTGALISILVGVAEFSNQDCHKYLSSALQFFLLSSLSCQLNVPGILYLKEIWSKRARELGKLLIAFSILLPTLYCCLTMNMLQTHTNLGNPSRSKVDFESWFLDKNSSHSVAYLTINTLLILLYISLCIFVVTKLKANKVKAVGRIFLIKQSGWISLTICSLNLGVFLFVNERQIDEATEWILAFLCALTGLSILCCYVFSVDGTAPGDETSKYFSFNGNLRGQRPDKNCGGEAGRETQSGYSCDGIINGAPSTNDSVNLIPLRKLQKLDGTQKCNGTQSRYVDHAKEPRTNESFFDSVDCSIQENGFRSVSRDPVSRNHPLHRSPNNICDIHIVEHPLIISPVPLSELLRSVAEHSDFEDFIPVTKAEIHLEEQSTPFRCARPLRTLTGGSYDSTCSSYDSALPRSRKNTSTTTTSGSTTVRSMSNASDHSNKILFEEVDDLDGNSNQTAGYVLMAGRSEFLITCTDAHESGSDENQARDTDSLLRQVREKVRARQTSSGESADHSSEQDSSDYPECQVKVKDYSAVYRGIGERAEITEITKAHCASTVRRKKTKRSALPASRSLPLIFVQKFNDKAHL